MAKDLNKVMIIGNLTRDPEVRSTQSGQQVASFGVATNRQWKNANGEKQEQVEFHDVTVWGKLAEICSQYLAKGRRAYFEGRLQTDTWEAQDGSKRQKTQIIADDMILLDNRGGGDAQPAGFNQASAAPAAEAQSQDPADQPAEKSTANAGEKQDTKPAETPLDDIPF